MNEPQHHQLYRFLWNQYMDAVFKPRRKELEKLMDRCQDDFQNDEFRVFIKTLNGYEKHWADMYRNGIERLRKLNY